MKKFGLIIAAIGTLAVAVPSIASAETVMIRDGGHHQMGRDHMGRHHMDRGWDSHAEMRRGRGWHGDRHPHHHDRVIVIKRHRH
jgi:hypothetical protein